MLVVWDTQTGVVIQEVGTSNFGKIMFHRDQKTITLAPSGQSQLIYTYNALSGILLCKDIILPYGYHWLGAHWTHGDTLWFATQLETTVNIYKLQPTSTPPASFALLITCTN